MTREGLLGPMTVLRHNPFHCQEAVIIHGLSVYERALTKAKSNFHFQKCPRPIARECLLTGMCK